MEVTKKVVDPGFWKNKKVFVTGHTGFKGSWLSIWLHSMGAVVKGYSLEPPTQPSLFEVAAIGKKIESETGDITNAEQVRKSIGEFAPEIVFHLAAQPLVRYSYENPVETYATNVMGTLHVLEAARACSTVKAIVCVTTDKCYENREWIWGYREDDPMGGHDPYSSSKGCAEILVSSYRRSFSTGRGLLIASARAGNVIGGGDWAQDRLIPDILKAFANNEPVVIRNPLSIRPWQHVLEPLSGYLVLAEKLINDGEAFAEAWNFGPRNEDSRPVQYILEHIIENWGSRAEWKQDTGGNPHEARSLKLDCTKAYERLNWSPKWTLEHTLDKIIRWHKQWNDGADMYEACVNEINEYNYN